MSVFFALIFFLNLAISMKSNFEEYLKNGEIESLDYNKFYVKECTLKEDGNVVFKTCKNLEKEKIELLSKDGDFVGLNYDIFLNDLYERDNFNVINKEDIRLKEGRYPLKYDEVIASDNYSIGEEIVVEANRIINDKKIDIYKDKITLKVVGITFNKPLIKEDKIYVDYKMVDSYFKENMLINNKKSLYEYFVNLELDTYKYILYFENINLGVLEDNNIEYLSSSYEYYSSLSESFDDIIKCLNYLNAFIILLSLIYGFRLVKKKMKIKENDLLFFKSSGVRKNKLVAIFYRENKLLIIFVSLISLVLISLIGNLLFEEFDINFGAFFIIYLLVLYFNKKLLNREIVRKISI